MCERRHRGCGGGACSWSRQGRETEHQSVQTPGIGCCIWLRSCRRCVPRRVCLALCAILVLGTTLDKPCDHMRFGVLIGTDCQKLYMLTSVHGARSEAMTSSLLAAVLIKAGANVDAVQHTVLNSTPLHLACIDNRLRMAEAPASSGRECRGNGRPWQHVPLDCSHKRPCGPGVAAAEPWLQCGGSELVTPEVSVQELTSCLAEDMQLMLSGCS